MDSTENDPDSFLDCTDLRAQFSWVRNEYRRITAINRIEVCAQVPPEGDSDTESFELVYFDCDISTANALKELDQMGMRPATFEELLAYAKKFPERQLKYPIVALGSVLVIDGDRCVPYLDNYLGASSLVAYWLYGDWPEYYPFLAVRK